MLERGIDAERRQRIRAHGRKVAEVMQGFFMEEINLCRQQLVLRKIIMLLLTVKSVKRHLFVIS